MNNPVLDVDPDTVTPLVCGDSGDHSALHYEIIPVQEPKVELPTRTPLCQAEQGRAKQRQGVRVGSKIKQNEKY